MTGAALAPALALTRPLLAWLREGQDWPRRRWRERAAISWQAHWGSWNARLSLALLNQSATVTELPDLVLIVGPWRSGTTVMHELLAAASGYATPRNWQCMNACTFALRPDARSGKAKVARPMDGLPIEANSPQEDEFALLSLGVATPYRAFLAPGRIGQMQACLDPQFWLRDPHWLDTWEAFLRQVLAALPASQRARPLLLKSPGHTFRLDAILRRYPAARVLWMARAPEEIFASNRIMWRQMFAAYGSPASPPDADALDAFLVRTLKASAEALQRCETAVIPANFVVVHHPELLAQPGQVLQRLRRRWGHDWCGRGVELDAALARVAHGRVTRYDDARLPPAAQAAAALLRRVQDKLGH